MITQLYVASDHASFETKKDLEKMFKEHASLSARWGWEDVGCFSTQRCDYPDFAAEVGQKVVARPSSLGLLFCGSGIGMSIAANKVKGIRAALCWDVTSARLARQHNDANVLCLGTRLLGPVVLFEVISAWLESSFEQGRHAERVKKISQLEGKL